MNCFCKPRQEPRPPVLGLICLALACSPPVIAGPAEQLSLIEQRIEQEDYVAAETICRQLLSQSTLTESELASGTAQLVRIHAESARNADRADRDALWRKSHTIAESFLQDHADNPQAILVQLQDAVASLTRAELDCQLAQLSSTDTVPDRTADNPAAAGLKQLRVAITKLYNVGAAIEKQQRFQVQRRSRISAQAFTATQLRSLRGNARNYLAAALYQQARCYPEGSPDRVNSCQLALAELGRLAPNDVSENVWLQSRIQRMSCLRMLGEFERAWQESQRLNAMQLPVEVQFLARAERILLLLSEGKSLQAMSIVGEGRSIDQRTSPTLDLAHLQALIANWSDAHDAHKTEVADGWQRRVAELLQTIRADHNVYWQQKADTIVAASVIRLESTDVRLQIRTAEDLYRRGQPEGALEMYTLAAEQAARSNDLDQQFELSFRIAAITNLLDRPREAQRALSDLALAHPQHPQAAKAYWQAVLIAGTIADQAPDDRWETEVEDYRQCIQQYVTRFPEAEHADLGRLWWGRIQLQRGRGLAALEPLEAVTPESSQAAAAVQVLGTCYAAIWASRKEADGLDADWLPTKIAHLGQIAVRQDSLGDAAMLSQARLRLDVAPPFSRREVAGAVVRDLSQRLAASQRRSDYDSQLNMLLVESLAAVGDWASVEQMTDQISAADWDQQAELLQRMDRLRREQFDLDGDVEVPERVAANRFIGNWVEQFRRSGPVATAASHALLQRTTAATLALSGDHAGAASIYAELYARTPGDGELAESLANVLTQSSDRQDLERAILLWRVIVQRSQATSLPWFRAKYGIARCHQKLGDRDEAERVVKILAATYPELGGAAMQAKFEALLK